MPTERFYRLATEKQKSIRDAAIQEFTRVPFEKASINQIILHADISRGSFYTYFEDKRDVLAFIFEDTQQQIRTYCKNVLVKNEGDFWGMMECLLDYALDLCSVSRLFELSRNLVMSPENFHFWEEGCISHNDNENTMRSRWLYDAIDKEAFKIQEQADFDVLFRLSMSALVMSVTHCQHRKENLVKIKEDFKESLKILKYGVYQ